MTMGTRVVALGGPWATWTTGRGPLRLKYVREYLAPMKSRDQAWLTAPDAIYEAFGSSLVPTQAHAG
jgi:hypothetical protein